MQEAALTLLTNSVWQAGLLASAGVLTSRVLARASAARRHTIWSMLLWSACLLPFATLLDAGERPAFDGGQETAATSVERQAAGVATVVANGEPVSGENAGSEEESGPLGAVMPVRAPAAMSRIILAVYAIVASILLIGIGIDVVRMMRLKARSRMLPRVTSEALAQHRLAWGVRRRVRYGASADIETPVFVGLVSPMLLLPARRIGEMTAAEIEQVGAHELAHAQRRDDWHSLLERTLRAFFFFNPAVQWMCTRIALEREMACDVWVVTRARATPDEYATTLLRIAERAVFTRRTRYASAFTGSCLRRRVEWLLAADFSARRPVSLGRTSFACATLLLAASAVVSGPSVAFTIQNAAAIVIPALPAASPGVDEAIDQLEAAGYSGAVLIARDGRVVTHRGFGVTNRSTKTEVTRETHFNSGALAKTLTAAAILKLEEQGRLSVNDRLSRWIGELPGVKNTATIHDLLVHGAGLTSQKEPVYDDDRGRFLTRVKNAPPEFAPGSKLRHTDIGYSVLAAIVEIAAGMPYEQFVRKNLIEPAGMGDTWFQNEPARGNVAYEYSRSHDPNSAVGTRAYTWGRRGAMGIYSNVGDLYRWQFALDSGLLTQRSLDRMRGVGIDNPWRSETGYGMETRTSSRGTTVHHLLSGWPGNSIELMNDPAARLTIALIIDNRVSWSSPRYDALARMALGNADASDLRHILYVVRD